MKKWMVLFGALLSLGFGSKPVIVFDFGGVMIDFDKPQMVQWCSDSLSVKSENIVSMLRRSDLATGATDEGEFWQKVARENGATLPKGWKEDFIQKINQCKRARGEMFELVRMLKASGYRTALFSDVTAWQAESFRLAGDYDLFSPVVLSCEIDTRKPNPKSYACLLERLGARAEECIFIDDRIENIEGAKEAGLRGIHFTSIEELKASLKELGVDWSADKYEASQLN